MSDYNAAQDSREGYEVGIAEIRRRKIAAGEIVPWVRREVIGDCTLYLGDCLEVLPTLGKVDAVVTSPPYGQQRDYGKKIGDWRALVSTAMQLTPAHETTQILVNLGLVHRAGEVVPYWQDLIGDMRADGWRHFGLYVWDQLSGMTGDWNGRLAPSFEFVFHFNRAARIVNKTKPTLGGTQHGPGIKRRNGTAVLKSHNGKPYNSRKIPDSVIRAVREQSGGYAAEHPARFPEMLARELIEPFSDDGDTILDPFMGSGTTLVACAKMGRRGIGIEIEPKYFDIAVRRVEEAYRQTDLFVQMQAPKPVQTGMFDDH
jgi:DNA modification methylase